LPQKIEEYRPISFLGNIYKVITKVLARRLKKVLNFLVSQNQSAFVSNRYMLDSVVMVIEVVDCAKKIGKQCLVCKLDFYRVCDSIS